MIFIVEIFVCIEVVVVFCECGVVEVDIDIWCCVEYLMDVFNYWVVLMVVVYLYDVDEIVVVIDVVWVLGSIVMV